VEDQLGSHDVATEVKSIHSEDFPTHFVHKDAYSCAKSRFATSKKHFAGRRGSKMGKAVGGGLGAGERSRAAHFEAGIRGHFSASATPASQVCGQGHGSGGYPRAPRP